MSIGLPAIASRRSCERSSKSGLLAARDRHDDRPPEIVAPGRLGDRRLLRAPAASRNRSARAQSRGDLPSPRSARVRRGSGAPPARARGCAGTRGRRPCGTSPMKVSCSRSRSCRSVAASAMAPWAASAAAPSIISVSGVMPMEKTAPRDDSRIASHSRDTEAATVGCSGGYSVQLRAATSRARASCSRPRASSGES